MILRFEITMPNNNSWNGVDTGNKGGHYAFRNVDKKTADKLHGTNHYYDFGDGWGANIEVKKARRSKSNGFRGYEWMIDDILIYGEIIDVYTRRYSNKIVREINKFISEFVEENGHPCNYQHTLKKIINELNNKLDK